MHHVYIARLIVLEKYVYIKFKIKMNWVESRNLLIIALYALNFQFVINPTTYIFTEYSTFFTEKKKKKYECVMDFNLILLLKGLGIYNGCFGD
jgi:hypothetical protein